MTNTQKGHEALKQLSGITLHRMDIDYEEYSTRFNWCMHRNPIGMPEQERRTFYEDVKTMAFDQMASKDLETIKQQRKQKKLQSKQVIE